MSTAARPRDDAVAGIVGFVLLLALTVSYYSYVAMEEVPVWGAQAETAWDRSLGEEMTRLVRASHGALGTESPVTLAVPQPPEPRTLNVPLLGRTEPIRPGGTLSLTPGCTGFTAAHLHNGVDISDVLAPDEPCIQLRAEPTYTPPFAYRMELGGLLRVQGDGAVVLAGPPLQVTNDTDGTVRLSLGLVGYGGRSATTSIGHASAALTLLPQSSLLDVAQRPNAASVTWIGTSQHADAWARWYQAALEEAGIADDRTYACSPAPAPAPECIGAPEGGFIVHIDGTYGDARSDVLLSISRGWYRVGLH